MADPSEASQWVEQIDDATLRTDAAKTVYDHWKLENPVAARQWLRELDGVDAAKLTKTLRTER